MDEQFLHYIWKYQKFNSTNLHLSDEQSLNVFYPGNHNHDSGPDFEEARIKIGDIEWAGKVEIHIRSSDWIRHNHQSDKAYESVILHVVWEHDKDIYISNEVIPTLELKGLVDPSIVKSYQTYLRSTDEILCARQIALVSSLHVHGMMDRVLVERLTDKSATILTELKQNTNDWEQVTYLTLAANFGFSTNKESFIRLARLLPFNKLKKELQRLQSTEALLFGQAGLLEHPIDDYQQELRSEFRFLQQKHMLDESLSKVQWKFGKLRPANFPSVRLSQFAALLHKQPKLFSFLIETGNVKEIKKILLVSVSDYWQHHYDFGKPSKNPAEKMGTGSIENVLINSVAPLLAAYAKYTDKQEYMDRAVEILASIPPERNRITKKWDPLGIQSSSAFDSQSLIQLYKSYCQRRRCLQCNIGVAILNQ